MAVEARHSTNNLFLSCNQIVLPNRDCFMKMNQVTNPTTTTSNINDEALLLPVYNQSQNSGLTHNPIINPPPRKRQRDHSFNQETTANKSPSLNRYSPFDIPQREYEEIDGFISQHTKEVVMELEKQKRREARMVVSALEEGIARRLREKDDEIARVGKLNWVLQERVKALCVENQLWKDIAHSNEATAASLRTDLHQVLLSASAAPRGNDAVAPAAGEDGNDAESCCGETCGGEDGGVWMWCRGCGEEEARVLVLPCRHLCLCASCGSHLRACPVCYSLMTGSVRVNFS